MASTVFDNTFGRTEYRRNDAEIAIQDQSMQYMPQPRTDAVKSEPALLRPQNISRYGYYPVSENIREQPLRPDNLAKVRPSPPSVE